MSTPISNLPSTATVSAADITVIVQDGVTKQTSIASLSTSMFKGRDVDWDFTYNNFNTIATGLTLISPCTASWISTYNSVYNCSGNWNTAYTKSLSSTCWNDVYDNFNSSCTSWNCVYNLVLIDSGGCCNTWNNSYTWVANNSGRLSENDLKKCYLNTLAVSGCVDADNKITCLNSSICLTNCDGSNANINILGNYLSGGIDLRNIFVSAGSPCTPINYYISGAPISYTENIQYRNDAAQPVPTPTYLSATGLYAVAMGRSITASGDYSFGLGYNNCNMGNCSFVIGTNLSASVPCYTFVNNISSQGIVYAGLQFLSSGIDVCDVIMSTITAASSNWDSTYSTVNSCSAQWCSTYSTVSSCSASWGGSKLNAYKEDETYSKGTSATNFVSNSGITIGAYLTANGEYAISLGYSNSASGNYSTVHGGYSSRSSACFSTVGGGCCNCAESPGSVVGGGYNNRANGTNTTVGGGTNNYATANCVVIGGGFNNIASGTGSTIIGGNQNCASGDYSTVNGGWSGRSTSCFSTVGGGCNNCAESPGSVVGGGYNNRANGTNATVGGGTNNRVVSFAGTIAGGHNLCVASSNGTVGGGSNNTLGITSECSTIGGGGFNIICCASNGTIGGGACNRIWANPNNVAAGTIAGGCCNVLSANATSQSNYSFIAGGCCNYSILPNTFVLGSSLTAVLSNYTYVNNLSSQNRIDANCLIFGSLSACSSTTATTFIATDRYISLTVGGSSLAIPLYKFL